VLKGRILLTHLERNTGGITSVHGPLVRVVRPRHWERLQPLRRAACYCASVVPQSRITRPSLRRSRPTLSHWLSCGAHLLP